VETSDEKSSINYTDLLVEVKFYIVGHHLPDDSDEFTGAVPKGIAVHR
jgi:hypothetical protein